MRWLLITTLSVALLGPAAAHAQSSPWTVVPVLKDVVGATTAVAPDGSTMLFAEVSEQPLEGDRPTHTEIVRVAADGSVGPRRRLSGYEVPAFPGPPAVLDAAGVATVVAHTEDAAATAVLRIAPDDTVTEVRRLRDDERPSLSLSDDGVVSLLVHDLATGSLTLRRIGANGRSVAEVRLADTGTTLAVSDTAPDGRTIVAFHDGPSRSTRTAVVDRDGALAGTDERRTDLSYAPALDVSAAVDGTAAVAIDRTVSLLDGAGRLGPAVTTKAPSGPPAHVSAGAGGLTAYGYVDLQYAPGPIVGPGYVGRGVQIVDLVAGRAGEGLERCEAGSVDRAGTVVTALCGDVVRRYDRNGVLLSQTVLGFTVGAARRARDRTIVTIARPLFTPADPDCSCTPARHDVDLAVAPEIRSPPELSAATQGPDPLPHGTSVAPAVAPAAVPPPVIRVPRITRATVTPRAVTLTLDRAARVEIRLRRRAASGRYGRSVRIVRSLPAGRHTVRLPRTTRPGRYRVSLVATADGIRARAVVRGYRVGARGR